MFQKNVRNIKFTFLCNQEERHMITAVANRLNRSQGDMLRFLIRSAVQELQLGLNEVPPAQNREQKNNNAN
jgi:hypothetical protein